MSVTMTEQWAAFGCDRDVYLTLPPDTTQKWFERTRYAQCEAFSHDQMGNCCRPAGHTGRHHAADGQRVLMVWP